MKTILNAVGQAIEVMYRVSVVAACLFVVGGFSWCAWAYFSGWTRGL